MLKIVLTILIVGLLTGFISVFHFKTIEKIFSKVEINSKTWQVELANSPISRNQGLSGRENLERGEGMLFIFPGSGFHGFWMKEMNFSLDIIWISEDLKVVGFKEFALPESFPEVFKPESPAKYVLEVNAGEVGEAGIEIGDQVKLF